MAIINLREYYPWYAHDELVEIPDIIAEELIADRRYERAFKRRTIYNGMTAEQFIMAWVKSEFITPKRLLFGANNIYYDLLKGGEQP